MRFFTRSLTIACFLAGYAIVKALPVAAQTLGFSKAFSPATVAPGEIFRLTYTIDNSANSIEVGLLAFTDFFPSVAVTPNAATTCGEVFAPVEADVDAVHPEYQSRPAHGWVRKGDKVALRRTSGRQRLNLHAALNLENFHCPLVEAERIDAASTIALLAKLEAGNPGKRRIYVIADNARYHHARVVRQ